MNVVKLKHNTPEWLAFRKNGIGGSDASAVLGMNPYKSNVELWEEKCGLKQPKPVSNNKAVAYGQKAEKHLRNLFALDFPEFTVIDKKDEVFVNGCMFGSLDGYLTEKSSGKIGVLEIKTAEIYQAMHKERWNERIPQNYYIQVLHYMAVMGAEFAILKAQLKYETGGLPDIRTKHYYFDRADEQIQNDINYLIDKENEFWRYVTERKRPNLILPEI